MSDTASGPVAAYLAEAREAVGQRDELVARMAVASVGAIEFNAAQDRLADRAPALLGAVEAVLALTRDSEGDDLYPSCDLTVGDVRAAISAALLGEQGTDDAT
jgi:hypothetical protein